VGNHHEVIIPVRAGQASGFTHPSAVMPDFAELPLRLEPFCHAKRPSGGGELDHLRSRLRVWRLLRENLMNIETERDDLRDLLRISEVADWLDQEASRLDEDIRRRVDEIIARAESDLKERRP
jgi:hypothetical protein